MACIILILYLFSLAIGSAAFSFYMLADFRFHAKNRPTVFLLPVLAVICAVFGLFHHLRFPGGYVISWVSSGSFEPSSLITAIVSVLISTLSLSVVLRQMYGEEPSGAESSAAAASGLAGEAVSTAGGLPAHDPSAHDVHDPAARNERAADRNTHGGAPSAESGSAGSGADAQSESTESENDASGSGADLFSILKEEFGLTERETELCALVCEGKSNPEIAAELFISENTVKTHMYNLFRKTSVSSRMELAALISDQFGRNPS